MIISVSENGSKIVAIDTNETNWETARQELESVYHICDQEFDLTVDSFTIKNISMDLVLTLVLSYYNTGTCLFELITKNMLFCTKN